MDTKIRLAITLLVLLVTFSAAQSQAKTMLPILLEAKPDVLTTPSVFETGKYNTTNFDVPTSSSTSPPKPLLIVTPIENGSYPVILFHHGTDLINSWYSDLLRHISSHGYIVVAPQLYEWLPPLCGQTELDNAAKVANWLPTSLQLVLPENVEGDLDRLAVAGHSRGGYIAFALALGLAHYPLSVTISALAGIGPVAGFSKDLQLEPKILTYTSCSFNLSIPITVTGTGLGDQPLVPLDPFVCAPDAVSHKQFFYECKPPCTHFVTTDYGHMDMLDDNIGLIGDALRSVCKGCKRGVKREPMRRTLGGIVVAFLKYVFYCDSEDYAAILKNPSVAPANLTSVANKTCPGVNEVWLLEK